MQLDDGNQRGPMDSSWDASARELPGVVKKLNPNDPEPSQL
jgi:hypothetical protein